MALTAPIRQREMISAETRRRGGRQEGAEKTKSRIYRDEPKEVSQA
jgi:hypothetical protein